MHCPSCDQEVSDSAKFCRHCRADLRSAPEASTSSCPNCASPVVRDAKFCKNCGYRLAAPVAPLPETTDLDQARVIEPLPPFVTPHPEVMEQQWEAERKETPPSPLRSKKPMLIALVAIAVIAIGAGGWWWSQQSKAPVSEQDASSTPPVAQAAATPTPATDATSADPAPSSAPAAIAPAPTEGETAPTSETQSDDAAAVEAEKKAAERKAADKKASDARKAKKEEEAKAAAAAKLAARERVAADAEAANKAALAKEQQRAAAPAPTNDWYSSLKADIAVCERENFFQKVLCVDKARRTYCPDHWNKVAECKAN